MSINTVITYPIPPYNNVPIQPQNFQPSQFVISALTLGLTTIVTTIVNNNYVIGQEIRLLIPNKNGSRGLNEQTGFVISKPQANQVEVNINSINIDPFIASPTFLPNESRTPPQIVAIGDINTGPINANGNERTNTVLPGSFINISPT